MPRMLFFIMLKPYYGGVMNGLALVIGNSKYSLEKDCLINAVNDADDISDKLLRLGFIVIKKINCTQEQFDLAADEFESELSKYDVGMFYFCGHGIQVDGKNFLTSIDTNLFDEYSVTRGTTTLDEIIKRMDKSNVKTKIIVLDACRNNPLSKTRGLNNPGLAPIHAPRGTIIAFSTSPGQAAKDGGSGRNSIYTGAFLKHIDDPEISIEDFFKRVRHSVYSLSKEQQTPWEHTSLIGDFSFNSGQLIHSMDLPYKETYISDSNLVLSKSKFDQVIKGLKSYVYTTQNNALFELSGLKIKLLDISQLFLMGRNIYQVSCDSAFEADKIMKGLDHWLEKYFQGDENHVLNGMLFEMYFNSHGQFRADKIKNKRMNELLMLQTDEKFKSSFDFINKQLRPFKANLFYIPSSNPKSIAAEIEFSDMEFKKFKKIDRGYKLESISFKGTAVYSAPNDKDEYYQTELNYLAFKNQLSLLMTVPLNLLRIITNAGVKDHSRIALPFDLNVIRK
jgi:hypothetical protein